LSEGVHSISPARISAHTHEPVANELPSVHPADVCKMLPCEFNALIQEHKTRLLTVKNFVVFKNYVSEDTSVAALINNTCENTSFESCWKPINGRLAWVQEFLGEIASVFAGIATVEAIFHSSRSGPKMRTVFIFLTSLCGQSFMQNNMKKL
jgi:hypothetical protein